MISKAKSTQVSPMSLQNSLSPNVSIFVLVRRKKTRTNINLLASCGQIRTRICQNEALAIPWLSIRFFQHNSEGNSRKMPEEFQRKKRRKNRKKQCMCYLFVCVFCGCYLGNTFWLFPGAPHAFGMCWGLFWGLSGCFGDHSSGQLDPFIYIFFSVYACLRVFILYIGISMFYMNLNQ